MTPIEYSDDGIITGGDIGDMEQPEILDGGGRNPLFEGNGVPVMDGPLDLGEGPLIGDILTIEGNIVTVIDGERVIRVSYEQDPEKCEQLKVGERINTMIAWQREELYLYMGELIVTEEEKDDCWLAGECLVPTRDDIEQAVEEVKKQLRLRTDSAPDADDLFLGDPEENVPNIYIGDPSGEIPKDRFGE